MLEKQSLDEFLSHCRNSEEKVIVSVSPQSRASLAAFFNLSPSQVCCSTRVVYDSFLFPLKSFSCAPQNHQDIKFVPARYLPYIHIKLLNNIGSAPSSSSS
jgi:hypothetical protein